MSRPPSTHAYVLHAVVEGPRDAVPDNLKQSTDIQAEGSKRRLLQGEQTCSSHGFLSARSSFNGYSLLLMLRHLVLYN